MDKENIKLEYRLRINLRDEFWVCPEGAEFFMDEHGLQWVKFFPSNGPNPGKEHMARTEKMMIVRDDR